MIVHVAQAAQAAFKWVVVATDDARIMDVCKQHGIDAERTGSDHATGSDRVAEVARRLEPDYVVNLQGDEPLIPAGHLRTFAEACSKSGTPVTNAMARLDPSVDVRDETIPKVVVGQDNRLAYISRSVVPNSSKSAKKPAYFRQIGLYGYTREAIRAYGDLGRRGAVEQYEDIEILRFLDLGMPVTMVELEDYGPAVDLPEHVALVERHMARRASRAQ